MKLTEYENMFSGKKANVFDFQDLWSKVLGVLMMFIIFAAGQNITKIIGSKLPIDTTIDPIVKQSASTPVAAIPSKQVL